MKIDSGGEAGSAVITRSSMVPLDEVYGFNNNYKKNMFVY